MAKWCKTLMVALILVGLPQLALTQDKPEAPGVTQDKPEAGIMQDKSKEMEQETAELQVVRDAVAEGIIDREPVDSGEVFSPSLGRIYYFTEVESSGPSSEITHVWYYGDREVARVSLPVEGSRWRTWSSKGILLGWIGQWKVEAVTAEGTVLASQAFSVASSPTGEISSAGEPGPPGEPGPASEPGPTGEQEKQ